MATIAATRDQHHRSQRQEHRHHLHLFGAGRHHHRCQQRRHPLHLQQWHLSGQTTTTNYSYGASSELLSKQVQGGATTTYSYDGNGNQTGSTGGPSFTYNAKDQATTLGSGTSATYSGTTQNERVKVNNTSYVYGTLGLTSQQTSSGTTAYVRCSCGLLNDARTPDGKKYYYLFDGLGSIVAMTDGTGKEVNAYDYDPYGNMVNSVEQSGLNNPWKFAGGFLDSSTGLYKYGIRYDDPTIGRWTQRTPVGGSLQETTKANPYVYADDDPVNAVDPSGADSSACIPAVFVA